VVVLRGWLFLLTALIGCATPYQPKGLFGGYEDYELKGSPGLYFVSFEGTTATEDEVVYRYWRQRAIEVCAGREWKILTSGARRGVVPVRRPRVNGYVRCGPPDPLKPDVTPR
jgi:hypothetical protein